MKIKEPTGRIRDIVKVEGGRVFLEHEGEVYPVPPQTIYGFTPIAIPIETLAVMRAKGYLTVDDMKAETASVIESDKAKGCRFVKAVFPLSCLLTDEPCEYDGKIENCEMEADLFCSGCGNSAPGWNYMRDTVTPCECGGRFIPAANTLMVGHCQVCFAAVEAICGTGSFSHCGEPAVPTDTKEKIKPGVPTNVG